MKPQFIELGEHIVNTYELLGLAKVHKMKGVSQEYSITAVYPTNHLDLIFKDKVDKITEE